MVPSIPAPLSIDGPTVVCAGIPVAYSVNPSQGATTHWNVVNGTIAGNATSGNEIQVIFDPAAITPYEVHVWYEGEYCNSAEYSVIIERDVLLVNLTSGSTSVCGSTFETYSINDVNAENYFWTINPPNAGSVQSGQNTLTPTILWNQMPMDAHLILSVRKCGTVTPFAFMVEIISSPAITLNVPPVLCTNIEFTPTFSLNPTGTFGTIMVDYGDNTQTTLTYAEYMASPSLLAHEYHDPLIASTTYTVTMTITEPSGCPAPSTSSAAISVSPSPVITLSPVSNLNLCDSENYYNPANQTYTVNIQAGVGQTYSIEWFRNASPNPTSISTDPTINAFQLGAGEYWAEVTNNFGCTSSTDHFLVYGDCTETCSAPTLINGVATNTACGEVTANLTVGDPNALLIFWQPINCLTILSLMSAMKIYFRPIT